MNSIGSYRDFTEWMVLFKVSSLVKLTKLSIIRTLTKKPPHSSICSTSYVHMALQWSVITMNKSQKMGDLGWTLKKLKRDKCRKERCRNSHMVQVINDLSVDYGEAETAQTVTKKEELWKIFSTMKMDSRKTSNACLKASISTLDKNDLIPKWVVDSQYWGVKCETVLLRSVQIGQPVGNLHPRLSIKAVDSGSKDKGQKPSQLCDQVCKYWI